MGQTLDRDTFSDAEYREFADRTHEQLRALAFLLARDSFGAGECSIGAELELNIIGRDGRPLGINRMVLAEAHDPRCTYELDRFNVEANLTPVAASGAPFSAIGAEMRSLMDLLSTTAAAHGGRIVPVGILPTLTAEDLQRDALTDLPRFRALANGLRRWRESPFRLRMDGADPLDVMASDITFEGANTSLQLHLRTQVADFARTYNAAQLVTPIALALGTNSPVFCGHRLWDETRVALFKQSLDHRDAEAVRRRLPARVSYGYGWVRQGAWELFAEAASLYPPIMPRLEEEREDAMGMARLGGLPRLRELRLHQGTVWRWNRAIYDPGLGGHLRIEFRALPAGPTTADMMASAAFLIGLTVAFRDRVDALLPTMPFLYCETNFYRAAQDGIESTLLWPDAEAPSPRLVSVRELAGRLLPLAAEGLSSLGVNDAEIARCQDVIEGRIATRTTGSRWQRRALARMADGKPTPEMLARMLEGYLTEMRTGRPVHEWRDSV